MIPSYRVGAADGCLLIKTTPVDGVALDMLSVRENTTVIVLNGYNIADPNASIDLLPMLGMASGESLFPGDFIVVPLNYKITDIRLAAGSAWGY